MSNAIRLSFNDLLGSQTSVKLSFTNIQSFRFNFIGCEIFLESNFPDNLALCNSNIDEGNFSVRGYTPLIWKDSVTHMHGPAVYA